MPESTRGTNRAVLKGDVLKADYASVTIVDSFQWIPEELLGRARARAVRLKKIFLYFPPAESNINRTKYFMKVKHALGPTRVMKTPHNISIPLRPHEAYLHDRARRISRDREWTGRLMEFLSLSKYSSPSSILSIHRVNRRDKPFLHTYTYKCMYA